MAEKEYKVEILDTEWVTHDVRKFEFEKPDAYSYKPGQATEVAIDKDDWRDEKRPFTFTGLNEWEHLEFVIKVYEDHDGVTKQIGDLDEGDCFIIGEPWGTIQYNGPGTFIAGGAGVTPFISIFRKLARTAKLDRNTLLFSNKTEKDIILQDEFEQLLGDRFINVITDEETEHYIHDFIDRDFLAEHIDDFDQHFYICGPMQMVEDLSEALEDLGASAEGIVFEE